MHALPPSQLSITDVYALADVLKTSTSVQTTPPMTATREAASTQPETTHVTAILATRAVYAKQVRATCTLTTVMIDKYLGKKTFLKESSVVKIE